MKGGDHHEVSQKAPALRSSEVRSASTIWAKATDWIPDVKCERPHLVPGRVAWPCGKCATCRSTQRRVWAHRIMLEASCYAENSFVTLTYSDKKCPEELAPDDFKLWVKRLRYFVSDRQLAGCIRYFGCGEYGDRTGRPHYHAAVFGIGCRLGPVRIVRDEEGRAGRQCECPACCAVRDSWSFGHTLVGSLEPRSAAYIAGYVLKKMNTTLDTTSRREPPFTRMSLKPGIGAGAGPRIAASLSPVIIERLNGDVPVGLRIGGSVWPLGRYLRNHLRELVGLDRGCPQHIIEELQNTVSVVYEYADAVAKDNPRLWRLAVQKAFEEVNGQLNRNVAARSIKRGSL